MNSSREGEVTAIRVGYINGLRGLCIMAVVWHHTMISLFEGHGYPLHLFGLSFERFPVLTQFWKGVDFFFILSGFVLYLPYFIGKRQVSDWSGAKKFYIRRAARLLPLFLFGFFVIFSLTHVYPPGSKRFLMELIGVPTLLFQFVNQGFQPPTLGPVWSVGVEILFSALFPLLILCRPGRSIGYFLAASLALSVATEISQYFFTWNALQEGLPYHLFNFILGMTACELVAKPQDYPRAVSALGKIAGLLPFTLVASLFLTDVANALHSNLLHMFANFLFSASAGSIVVVLGTGKAEMARKLLEIRWLQLIGAMCFSIYMWHLPIFFSMFSRTVPVTLHQLAVNGPFYLFLVLVVSAMSYRFIEFPQADFRGLFFLGKPRTKRQPSPTEPLPADLSAAEAKVPADAVVSPAQ